MDFSYCVDIDILSSLITRTLKSHLKTMLMSFTNLQILQFANVWSKCVGCLTSKGISDRLGGTGVDWLTGQGIPPEFILLSITSLGLHYSNYEMCMISVYVYLLGIH